MDRKWMPILRKITRIWSVVMIILGVLIFIAEIFETRSMALDPYPWWENLMPASMFLAILCLGVAWRWEALGGAMAIGLCLFTLILYLATGRDQVFAVLLITLPVLVPGLLFLLCAWRTRAVQPQQTDKEQ